jgi:peptide deformylase
MRLLQRTLFGNPILRLPARQLSSDDIASPQIQELIADMRYTLENRRYGVGLAAPQIGQSVSLSVIAIKPTPSRPDNPNIGFVIINPEIVRTYGELVPKWEGCLSFGSGPTSPYAQASRYEKIRIKYLDEQGIPHETDYDGLVAHVLQHEIDHLNGILFVDKVQDPKTFITISEYKKRYLKTPS